MNRSSVLLLLACSAVCFAQTPQIKSGSTVYIKPMGGYETYLAAAFLKKHVPLVLVANEKKAEYALVSTVAHQDLGSAAPAVVVNNSSTAVGIGSATDNTPAATIKSAMQRGYAAGAAERMALGETSVGIAVIDPRSSKVIFAYTSGKMGTKQIQKTAEDCAKHLKKFIEKSEKATKDSKK